MSFGVDFATAGLTYNPASLQAAGVTFVARYLNGGWKGMTRQEADALRATGIDIVGVWESTATRASAGFGAGQQDASAAHAAAVSYGMPTGRPVYFAVDFDASAAQVIPYFQGVASVLGAAGSGVYAGINVVDPLMAAGIVGYGWQTYAWSGGRWGTAQLQQYSNGHPIAGLDTDYDRSVASDFGQWSGAGASPGGIDVTPEQLAQIITSITEAEQTVNSSANGNHLTIQYGSELHDFRVENNRVVNRFVKGADPTTWIVDKEFAQDVAPGTLTGMVYAGKLHIFVDAADLVGRVHYSLSPATGWQVESLPN